MLIFEDSFVQASAAVGTHTFATVPLEFLKDGAASKRSVDFDCGAGDLIFFRLKDGKVKRIDPEEGRFEINCVSHRRGDAIQNLTSFVGRFWQKARIAGPGMNGCYGESRPSDPSRDRLKSTLTYRSITVYVKGNIYFVA